MRLGLDNRVAVVTGGARGIGRGACHALAAAGAHTVVADLDKQGAELVAREVVEAGGTASASSVDVGDPSSCAALVRNTVESYGRMDVLFHAAGIQFQRTLAVETSDADWDRFIRVNLSGTFYICRAAIPALIDSGGGTITLMASGRVYMGAARSTAYAASKGGVASFTRSLAWEVGPHGINVNCLVPGLTDTDGSRQFQREVLGRDPSEVIAEFAGKDPMRAVSTPADVGTMVVYLSTAGRWITGQMHSLRVYTW